MDKLYCENLTHRLCVLELFYKMERFVSPKIDTFRNMKTFILDTLHVQVI